MDMKIEPFLLVSTLNVIIAQRLIRKLSENKEKKVLSKDKIAVLRKSIDLDKVLEFLKKEKVVKEDATWEKIPFYSPVASDDAPDGYSGRVGIYEVFQVSPTIKELILKSGISQAIDEQARKEGMMTMIEDGIFKAVQGLTTIEEVLRVISSE